MARPKKYEDKNGKTFYGFESEADLKSYVKAENADSNEPSEDKKQKNNTTKDLDTSNSSSYLQNHYSQE